MCFDKIKPMQMEAEQFIDEFPTLLHRLQGLQSTERMQQIEDELKAGLLHLDALLTEVQQALASLRKTADKIGQLEKEE